VQAARDNWTVPPVAPQLQNPNFECAAGFYATTNAIGEQLLVPNGWTLLIREGAPTVSSTRLRYAKTCDGQSNAFIEKLEGADSLIVLAQDVDTPPLPGKVFDMLLYQQVRATYGGDYSLSGWLISLCGNKSKPFDCPPENYIVKAVGIDPYGGIDPDSPSIVWEENRLNFVDTKGKRLGWQNLRLGVKALAQDGYITVFARMNSPFQFHGNMGFMDAFSLVRAPLAELESMDSPVSGPGPVRVAWFGQESPDIRAIPSGTHRMLYDVQTRPVGSGEWRDLVVGATAAGEIQFTAPCLETVYEFRVRARAEQPEGIPGAWPNHRYPGVWSKAVRVHFVVPADAQGVPAAPVGPQRTYLPALVRERRC
jgi:hypothetical protein